MKLTEEQIRSITVGAIQIKKQTDGYHFFKCTEKQMQAFYELDEGLGNRSKTTTGVRLDFHTSSPYITFETATAGKYEVLVDGIFAEQFLPDGEDRFTCEFYGALEEKKDEYRVTLVLPSHAVGVISSVELADGATLRAHEYDKKILFIGDSITQGWDSRFDSFSFAYRISFFLNAESIIQGTGGARFHAATFDTIDFDPDTVFVALGTNDFSHYASKEELASYADAHLARIAKEYKGKELYYISPIWRADWVKKMGSFADARRILIEKAAKHGFKHIDGFTLVPPHAAFFQADLLHPNMHGFAQYTENLLHFLLKQTKRMQ